MEHTVSVTNKHGVRRHKSIFEDVFVPDDELNDLKEI